MFQITVKCVLIPNTEDAGAAASGSRWMLQIRTATVRVVVFGGKMSHSSASAISVKRGVLDNVTTERFIIKVVIRTPLHVRG